MDWNEGYVTETGYTYGFYTDFNPVRVPFLFGLAGITPPAIKTACELGYGQGISLNIYAAAEQVAWWGTDFNPSQAENAREMARASGAKAYCLADSFRDFCERDDLPEFDYIALHGIWSWISRENQAEILHLIDKKLRVGGVLYISYNTFPGWAPMVPAREMMRAYSQTAGSKGEGVVANLEKALEFMDRLMALDPAYAKAVPQLKERLNSIKGLNHTYLVHEFLNEAWDPVTFAQMAAGLTGVRMNYACSATFLDSFDNLGFSKEQQEFLAGIKDTVLRQMTRDFIRNIQFRKDFWIKGKLPLGPRSKSNLLREQQVILVKPDVTREIKGSFGTMTINEAAFEVLMSVLGDLKPHTLAEIEKAGQNHSQTLSNLLTPICAWLDVSILQVAQKRDEIVKSRPTSDRVNQYLEQRAMENRGTTYLASPVTGGGVGVGRFEQIFLQGLRRGHKTQEDLAHFLWLVLSENGERIAKEGKPLMTEEESMPELLERAQKFTASLPVLRAMLIA